MALVVYVEPDGTRKDVDVDDGASVMEGAVNNAVDGIAGECGGGLACATCHCYVDPAWVDRLDPPSAVELDMLESASSPLKPGSRLSCQIVVGAELDGLVVELPPSQY